MIIIGRAATTPLRLQVLGYNVPQKVMDIVLSNYPRIQSLSIESLSPAHHKLLRAAAAKDTTGTLQDVILHITASSMSFEDTMPNVQRLRSLNLSGFTIRPSWQGFSPSLIALSLSSILPSHGVYLSTDEVLQIMQHCPRLEIVELHYVVSRADPVQTPSSDPVRLDGLTMLAFSGDPLCFRWLLERLAYPSNARLHVTLLSPVVGVESSDAELGELLASKLAPRLLAAHFELDHLEENPALVVSAWVSLPEPWLPLQRPNFHTTPHIRIVLTMTAEEPAIMYANWPIQETFPFLQALKPLAGIEYIGFRLTTCCEETGLDMATFIPVVAQMPNIRVFDAPELDEKTCWLLSSRPRANLSPSSHSWPFLIFPDLERINILTPDAPNAAYLLCLVTHMMQVRKQFSAGLTELWFMPDDENPTDEMTSIEDLTDRELFPEYDEIRDVGVRCMYYNPASHHPVQVME